MIECDADDPHGKHVFIFDGEKRSMRCLCGAYDATRGSHLEFTRQVVPASAVPPICRECGAPGKLYERPAERRWVHAKVADGRHHDFAAGEQARLMNPADCMCEYVHASSLTCPSKSPSRGAVPESERITAVPVNQCNRHMDCKRADEAWLARHPGQSFVQANFHCYDATCEDCFGS